MIIEPCFTAVNAESWVRRQRTKASRSLPVHGRRPTNNQISTEITDVDK
jgi:hypothetical protein